MSEYETNGYVVSILENAKVDLTHRDHSEAISYLTKFRDLELTFNRDVHPHVDVGLAISEVQLAGEGRLPHIFTVHGCRHVSDLIKSLDKFAKEISESSQVPLSVLEAYILLCAAHVHDAANIEKRDGHPERCNNLLQQYKALFAGTAIIQQVYNVASVHGGKHPEYGRDTFRSIEADNSLSPRLPLLAAMLRLGDELSENPERIPEPVVRAHPHSAESTLAFAYAKSFTRFEFKKESLYLVYGIYPPGHQLRVTVDNRPVTFLEFLEAKIDVIDREARYCSQYARPVLNIGQISVTIHLYKGALPSSVALTEKFTLHLSHGYPLLQQSLCERSPELKNKKITRLEECFLPKPVPGQTPGVFQRLLSRCTK
jgi:hypothetical protein